MELALSTEEPPRLVVVCNDDDEYQRLCRATELLGLRVRQAERIGLSPDPSSHHVEDTKIQMGQTALSVNMAGLTGREKIFALPCTSITTLRSAAFLARGVLAEEVLAERLNSGIWQAHRAVTRHPYYRHGAERVWDATVASLEVSLLSLPRVEVTSLTPTTTANPESKWRRLSPYLTRWLRLFQRGASGQASS